MTNNLISIQFLIRKLRYKQRTNPALKNAIDKIVWYSLPVVYPNLEQEQRQITAEIESRKKRVYRSKQKIKDIIQCYNDVAFITLTFSDGTFSTTTERTRHRYVTSFLKEHSNAYVGNIDYGSKNQREHYHAVIALKDDKTPLKWPYGFQKIKSVRKTNVDANKIGKYINKLSAHSGKITAGHIFSSRCLNDVDELPF